MSDGDEVADRTEHDKRRFSVLHESSENLLASDGRIHERYNGWIENLVARIGREPTWVDPLERPTSVSGEPPAPVMP